MTLSPRCLQSVLAALALLVAACGGGDGSGDTADDDPTGECPVGAFEDANGPTEVVVWHSYVGKTKQTLDKIGELYNESQDAVEVSIEAQGASYEELLRKFQQAIPTGDLPAVIIGEDTNTQYMRDSGVILTGQDCYDADAEAAEQIEDMLPGVRAAYSDDGRLIPATMNASALVLYYNRGHFEEAGLDPDAPPETLQEVEAAARAIKAARPEGEPIVMNLDPWVIESWTTGVGQTEVDMANGREGLAENATFDSDTTLEVFDWLVEMESAGLLNAIPQAEGQINHFLAVATQSGSMLFETSTAITTIDAVIQGNLAPEDLGLDESFSLPPINIDVGVGLNPGIEAPGKGQAAGGAWYIANTNDDGVQSAAWDFVKYFNLTDTQVLWTMEGSYLPMLASVAQDPVLQEDWDTNSRGEWTATAYEGLTTLDPEFPGPLIGPYDKFRQEVRGALEAVVLGGEDPSTQISGANEAITGELQSYADTSF